MASARLDHLVDCHLDHPVCHQLDHVLAQQGPLVGHQRHGSQCRRHRQEAAWRSLVDRKVWLMSAD